MGTHTTRKALHASRRTLYATRETLAREAQDATRETLAGTSERARTKRGLEEHRRDALGTGRESRVRREQEGG